MAVRKVHAVCAVISRDYSVFSCQRGHGDMQGGWEFPGGKVEKGETGEQALRREISEELAARLSTVWFLDTVEQDYGDFHLTLDCYVCTLAPGEEPTLLEHSDARWLGRDELLDVDWLPADRKVAMSLGGLWDALFSAEHL